MFEGSRQSSPAPWALLFAGVLTFGAAAAAYQLRPPPPPPPPPYVAPFSWDEVGLKLHRDAAVARCFDERRRSPDDDPEQVVSIVFGQRIKGVGWDPHGVVVVAGPHRDLERCLMREAPKLGVLEPGATESVGWRVKLATWDRHPLTTPDGLR